MFNASVETTTTYQLTTAQIEEIILKAAGIERGPGVHLRFNVHESYDHGMHGGYESAGLDGAVLTITKKEKK